MGEDEAGTAASVIAAPGSQAQGESDPGPAERVARSWTAASPLTRLLAVAAPWERRD